MFHAKIIQLRALQLLRIYQQPFLRGCGDKRRIIFRYRLRIGNITGFRDRKESPVLLHRHHKFREKPGACGIVIQIDRKSQLNILLVFYNILRTLKRRLIRLFLEKIIIPVVTDGQILRLHGYVNLPRLRVDQAAFNRCKICRILRSNIHFPGPVFDPLYHVAGGVHQRPRGVLSRILSDAVLSVLGFAVLGQLHSLHM